MPKDNPIPVEKSTSGKSNSSSSQLTNTETLRKKKTYSRFLVALMDEKVPIRNMRKLLRELATVKDGTVRFEVPEDVKSQSLDFGAGGAYNDVIIEEHVDAIDNHITPLQIVMLIVGTQGDVQPFVAIGKGLHACGHRVRLATHSDFKEFFLNVGLEFF